MEIHRIIAQGSVWGIRQDFNMLNEETSIINADDLTKINEFINRPEEIFTNFDDKLSVLQWFHLWFVHTSLHCSLRLVVDVHFQRLLIRNIPVDAQSVPSILSPEIMKG